jgi:hypothetical protein
MESVHKLREFLRNEARNYCFYLIRPVAAVVVAIALIPVEHAAAIVGQSAASSAFEFACWAGQHGMLAVSLVASIVAVGFAVALVRQGDARLVRALKLCVRASAERA